MSVRWKAAWRWPRAVKFIKVHGTHNSASGGFHIVELEAFAQPPKEPRTPSQPSQPDAE